MYIEIFLVSTRSFSGVCEATCFYVTFQARIVFIFVCEFHPEQYFSRWVRSNVENARRLEQENRRLRQDYSVLKESIEGDFHLSDIRWTCGWRGTHRLASLRSLRKLLDTEQVYCPIVKGTSN